MGGATSTRWAVSCTSCWRARRRSWRTPCSIAGPALNCRLPGCATAAWRRPSPGDILGRALARQPEDRFQTAAEFGACSR